VAYGKWTNAPKVAEQKDGTTGFHPIWYPFSRNLPEVEVPNGAVRLISRINRNLEKTLSTPALETFASTTKDAVPLSCD
jgi:hypothetical protein